MKKETISTIVQLVEDRAAANAKIAELERQLAEACLDASAPAEASVRTGEGRGSGLDSSEALRESVRLLTRQRNQARAEADRLRAHIEAAWKAFPSRGAVRGLASLADVIEGLVSERDGLQAELERNDLHDALEAALRPDVWECSLSTVEIHQIALHEYHSHEGSAGSAVKAVANVVTRAVLANLRRKGGAP